MRGKIVPIKAECELSMQMQNSFFLLFFSRIIFKNIEIQHFRPAATLTRIVIKYRISNRQQKS